ncbi:TonB-dependent receptor [Massilia terrae]|uniref:TonB-dependent receptor n=1 Tax=Massilia terrae TaxID=1811224 RepID=A0ABT2CT07_9BURK|nr:TonB-dependent receptor [Massilia terrae]MCS0657119.1 TonB-dependent receptor [Massilia terrae]
MKSRQPARLYQRFQIKPIAAACTLLLVSGAGYAQEVTDTTQTVVVTGIRKGIEGAIEAKKASNLIIEAVSAEDLGKLPDSSIADSIARLPGLAAQRVDGRPSAISIRGLGPDYAGSVINGREVVSSGDGRAAEYDQFPSELVNQVLVYKTPDATLVGQGLSGTIDIRPAMPLDFQGRQMSVNVRGEKNSYGKLNANGASGVGNRISASYLNQFLDRTVGFSIGFAHLDSPGQAKNYESWKYGDYVGQWGAGATGLPAGSVASQGFTASNVSSKQKRDGLMSVLEYRPNKNFRTEVDMYYSKFTQDRVTNQWTGDLGLWADPASAYSNVGTSSLNGNTVVSSGTVANGTNIIDDKNFNRTDDIRSAGWKSELKLDPKWTTSLDVGLSKAKRHERLIESIATAQPGKAIFKFSGLDSESDPGWSTNQDLTNPAQVTLTNNPNWAQLVTPSYTDEIKSLRLNAARTLDSTLFSKVQFGINQTRRDKVVNSAEYSLALAHDNMAIPANALAGTTNIRMGNIDNNILAWNVPAILGLYTATSKNPWDAKDQAYSIHERVTTSYAKLDIDTDLGKVPVRGNLGVQAVHTQQLSNGFAWNDSSTPGAPGAGSVIPVTGGAKYTDYLPSLNLNFELMPDLYARVGAAKTMARPRMDDMRAGADQPKLTAVALGSSVGTWSAGSGGKPDLQPWRAKSLDFSLEKYFGKSSYIAAAMFYKKLQTFIYNQTTTRDFSGFPNYSNLTPGCPVSNQSCNPNLGTISAMANGEGGKVYGMELSASLDGSLLTPVLSGYGVVASVSGTRNQLPDDNNGNKINLDGFSGVVNSVTAYYEKNGFSTRISRRYRSAFTASTRSILLSTEYSSHIDAESQVDFQLGYSFEQGPYKGLSILLQVNNVTNAPSAETAGPEIGGNGKGLLPWKYNTYGRQFLLGASYKF